MLHKVTTSGLVDGLTPTAQIVGACNAILRREDGKLLGDQFEGTGFVRSAERKGCPLKGARAPSQLDIPKWDSVSQKKVRDPLLILGSTIPGVKGAFGTKEEVDPVRGLI
jgi:hypothetical protein